MRVYVIAWRGAGPCKIGIAEEPEARLKQIQTANPFKLKLYLRLRCGDLARQVEMRCHMLLERQRLQGEWFLVSVRTAVDTVRESIAFIDADAIASEQRDSVQPIGTTEAVL